MFVYLIRSTKPGCPTEWSWISQHYYFATLILMEQNPDAWRWTQLARVEVSSDVYA